MPGTGGSTLLAATTLQGDDTGPVSEKHSDPGQADVSLSCLQDSSQTYVRTRLILLCPQKGQVVPPSGQSHGHSVVLLSLMLI